MKKQKYMVLFFLISSYLCIDGMVYSLTPTEIDLGKGFQKQEKQQDVVTNVKEVYQSLVAALTGAVLSSGCFLFFLKRMISQYDDRHDKHDKQILDLYIESHDFEKNMNEKLHNQCELIEKEMRNELTTVTQKIIASLDSLKDTIQELVTDLTTLQVEHNSCDYRAGDITLIQNKIEHISKALTKIEKAYERHKDESH
jgi:hypothetical protein